MFLFIYAPVRSVNKWGREPAMRSVNRWSEQKLWECVNRWSEHKLWGAWTGGASTTCEEREQVERAPVVSVNRWSEQQLWGAWSEHQLWGAWTNGTRTSCDERGQMERGPAARSVDEWCDPSCDDRGQVVLAPAARSVKSGASTFYKSSNNILLTKSNQVQSLYFTAQPLIEKYTE